MTFAVPFFLLAAAAGIIPVILHMINRQRAKDLPFPTLRFLKISSQKTRRRRRIQDVALMLIRVAVLLLIALGLARPTLTNLRAMLGGGAHLAAAIVLDNSASMGNIEGDRTRMEAALAAAEEIMSQLEDGDQVALFVTNGVQFPEAGRLDRGQDLVRQMLAQCKVSYEHADLGAKIEQARNLLAKADAPNKQLFVLSDFQSISFNVSSQDETGKQADQAPLSHSMGEGQGARAAHLPKTGFPSPSQSPLKQPPLSKEEQDKRDMPLVFVDLNRAAKPNVAVQKVQTESALPVAGLPIKVVATLRNASPVPLARRAELWIDDAREVTSPELSLGPKESVRAEFVFRFKTGGLHRGEVRLVGDEGSKLDDRRLFSMEIDQGIPVGVVKSQTHEIPYLEDTFYVEKALGQGRSGTWALRTSAMTATQLATDPLNHFKVLFCVNLPAPEEALAGRLKSYVEQGGHLFWICGDNVLPDAYNEMNERADQKLLPAPLLDVRAPSPNQGQDFWRIGSLDADYPPLSTLVTPPSLYQSVLVYKHQRMDTAKAGNNLRVLARLEDGEPLLVERKVGRGSVTMLATSGHVNWTNLPVRPLFLPLLAQLTFHLSGTIQVQHEVVAGVPITLSFADEIRPAGVEIVPPSGETIRRNFQEEGVAPDQPFRYTDTHDVGFYTVRFLQAVSPTQLVYSVNVDPDEADPDKVTGGNLESVYPNPMVFVGFDDDQTLNRGKRVKDLPDAFKWLRQGQSLLEMFLWIVLAILVFETLVSNLFSPKSQDDQQLQQVPVGMRRLAKKGRVVASG